MLERVITGGQTGVDQGALRAARASGLDTGGYCQFGCYTEAGRRPELIKEFGLSQIAGTYADRTRRNVLSCDAVLILSWVPDSPGTRLTCRLAERQGCPWVAPPKDMNDASGYIAGWLARTEPRILMVAGNRESVAPGIGAWAEELLCSVFRILRMSGALPAAGGRT
jgi:hypothetical protein